MADPTPSPPPSPVVDALFAIGALAALVLPAVAVILAPTEPFTLEQERRNAAALPVLEGASLGEGHVVTEAFERWFGDRLGLRRELLRAHAEIYLRMFDESPHHAVLFGKDGWLFQNAPEMVAVARHLDPFDEEGLARWRGRIERRRAVAQSVGAEYIFSVAPCKATVFPEKLRDAYQPIPGPTRVDELFGYLGEHSDVRWIDVRPALLAAKERDRIYSKTGLHWTDSGAYWGGYRPFLAALAELGPPFDQLQPHPREAFREQHPIDPHESLGLRLYLADYFPAEVHKLRLPKAPKTVRKTVGGPGRLRLIQTAGAPPVSALVLRDSFGTAFLPLLSMHFAETYHILPLRVPEPQILNTIRTVAPDVVIDFMYETVLYTPEEILFTNREAEAQKAKAKAGRER